MILTFMKYGPVMVLFCMYIFGKLVALIKARLPKKRHKVTVNLKSVC